MKVFWDTNVFIYLIERHPVFHAKVLSLYEEHRTSGHEVVTSALTLGELLAQPIRHSRRDLHDAYLSLLTGGAVGELVAFDRRAAEHYARIRAETALRQPDALQLACAAACGASLFVTNDQRLWGLSVPGTAPIRGL